MRVSPLQTAARVALWYAPFGLIWVLFHDRIFDAVIRESSALAGSDPFKDWLSYISGGLVLFALIWWQLRAGSRAGQAAKRRQESMRSMVRAAELRLDDSRRLLELAGAAVPTFADWCVVDLVDQAGSARRAAVVHGDAARAADAELLRRIDLNQPDRRRRLQAALDRLEPTYHEVLTDSAIAAACTDEYERRLLCGLRLCSAIAVPIRSGDRSVGLITFYMAGSGRHFGPDDLALAAELSERLGLALDHAKLLRQALAADKGRKEAEAALLKQERLYRLLANHARDLVLLLDMDGAVLYASPSCQELLGYCPLELQVMEHLVAGLVHPEDHSLVRRLWAAISRGEEPTLLPFRAVRKDGTWVWLEPVTSLVQEGPDGPPQVQAILRDITERKRFEERLSHQAFHDGLTGLPNRSLLLNRLEHALARGGRRQQQFAVLFMDLDSFKFVNDSLGHEAGDQLLVELSRRLQGVVRAEDTIARMGGDEFAVLLESVSDADEAAMVAGRVADALRPPMLVRGHELTVTASVGIVLAPPGQYQEPGALLRDADAAMYRAKAEAKGRYVLFEPRMNQEDLDRLVLEADLRHAVERNEFVLHFQPIVAMESGQVLGVEALVRWQHPQRGLLGPGQFIPLAEETGLILEIGRFAMWEACRQVREWQGRYGLPESFYVSVNMSVRQLQLPDLADRLNHVLEETGLPPQSLQVEITESVTMRETPGKLATLRAIKALGVRLAVDDFGTGYSSLSYLKRFPIDVLKIDRSFVSGLDSTDEAILWAIVAVGRALHLNLVAEGVETAEQAARLQTMGCRCAQGFYYFRPLPPHVLEPLLWQPQSGTAD